MSNCNSCPSKGSCNKQETCTIENNPNNKIKNVIGIMSGKGGVGKSTVTALIAKQLNKMGYKVGILDADITGPSIPRLMGVQDERAVSPNGKDIYPIVTGDNIKTMSINFMVGDENQAIVWKGPIISNTVKQFYKDVMWEELDYLLIDMPPGTGDVPLTVMQNIPLNGVIMVSVPQDMISMIVAKAVNMAKMLNVKVLGVVENMSYIQCPDCNKKIKLFDGEETEKFLKDMNLNLLGELPMTKEIVNITHNGVDNISPELNEVLNSIVEKIK
ncbi:ATP-binding protein [[Clostridium] sordellii]|uniref:Iron-sulfur cluster carrier protein n=1 Tax=Paraclostridium sordellii TaxID=1505 RepID=A0ABM9RR37_PARSO|nr:Mrp/NBP35 family ATP-binding protein [Paeniclostridium sordellii]MBX9181467.1 Mrp/NBP35 family ATP-binding protein [Paeniclostridium sordellii]CEJ74265.1 putative ATP-binding protein [[Clostridium] sordellii] [Paeniclostridium sordellii]CEK33246.1 ATP-binding protein,antiporter inner membrane protein,CO dehydrogenase maturation factor,cell division ATPase MinD,ParA/MinD ATPase like [[Clostridium] sordellii] [Paeniclostridium sordellii]CEN69807.1 ATP-binding protein [[Clostridium] sordellii] 